MPFDGAGFATDDRLSKIDQVIDLLATHNQWCKAQFKTPDGRYCIRGAMQAVDGADEVLKPVVLRAIREVTGRHYLRVESFNDHPHTQHEQVLRVLHRARQLVVNGRTPAFPQPECTRWSALLDALRTRLFQADVPPH